MLAEKFDECKEEFIEEGVARGRREGIAEGRIEGEKIGMDKIIASQKLTLLEMLAQRFGAIPVHPTGYNQTSKIFMDEFFYSYDGSAMPAHYLERSPVETGKTLPQRALESLLQAI